MPDYDPSMEALVTEMLTILAPDVEADALGYIEQLRAVQTALVDLLTGKTTVAQSRTALGNSLVLTPEQDALLRMALGKLDAKAGDGELEGAEVIRRLLSCVDRELMKWTSALVQEVGPSGDAVVAGGGVL